MHAAFSLEAAALEATYIVGPVVIAGAIGAWSTSAATLTCAALLIGGVLAFTGHAASRAWRPERADRAHGAAGALRSRGVRTLMLVFALLGATFGSIEIAVPVAAEAAGHAGAAGLLLGVWGLGSLIGGLLAARAGAARRSRPAAQRAAGRARRRPPAADDPARRRSRSPPCCCSPGSRSRPRSRSPTRWSSTSPRREP